MAKKSNTQEFIDRAQQKIHGDRYDYSLVDYKNDSTKVIIICKEHGEFLLTPKVHLRGQGCPACSKKKNSTIRIEQAALEFEPKARVVHLDTYDYSEVVYVDCKTKVIIICKEHGEFRQRPNSHLRGHGCTRCSNKDKGSSIQEFIDKVQNLGKHGDKYDYSKVDYKNATTKVIIICKEHGEFRQTPSSHLDGHGCHSCSKKKNSAVKIKKAALEFEPKSRIIHSDKYDYSKVDYINNATKVKIICKEHGEFLQTPFTHLRGSGCTECSRIKKGNWLKLYETNKELGSEPGIFYLLKFKHNSGFEFIKAGITNRSIQIRYQETQYNDFTYEIIEEHHSTNLESAQKEKEFLREYKEYKFDFPEDIKFSGHTETFNIDLLDTY